MLLCVCEPMQCELEAVNKICTKRCAPEELRRWCPRKPGGNIFARACAKCRGRRKGINYCIRMGHAPQSESMEEEEEEEEEMEEEEEEEEEETSKEKKEGEVCCCACLLLVDCARSTEKTYCHVKSQGKVLIGAWIAKGGEEGGQRKRQRERERGRDRERIARAASLHARR